MEINKEVQEVIDYVLEHEPDINFKVCTECGRNLPVHDWFYGNHPLGKYGKESKCKECKSRNNTYKFQINLREIYYLGIKDEFINKFRYMSFTQLEKYFKLTQEETVLLANKLKLKKTDVINTLTEEEVIFMYNSLLKGEIKVFTNGVYNNDKYIVILMKYMISQILKWNRDDICKNLSTQTLKNNGLGGLLGIKKFNMYECLVKSFPEYNIMPWELEASSVGNGFWTEENIEKALNWFALKLLKDKNIDNINIAGTYGFGNLVNEYNFNGLCTHKFAGSYILLFEKMYNETFNKNIMLKDNYTFEINIDCVTKVLENKIYKLTDSYYNLDDRGKTLINEVIRFCENEKKFPVEKDLNNKSGYISRTQYYKYFGETNIRQLYNYILPVYDFSKEIDINKFKNLTDGQNYNAIFIKPEKIKCIECGEIKDFTEHNFPKVEAQKFGLKYICKSCENKYSSKLLYKKKDIIYKRKEDISPIEWWNNMYQNKIKCMPDFCYLEENLINIIKHVINNVLQLFNKDDICNSSKFGIKQLEKYRIESICHRLGGKVIMLQKCFPEFNITENDVYPEIYTDEEVNKIINEWINNNNLNISDLLKKGLSYKFDKKMNAMMAARFYRNNKNMMDMIIWYCKENNILHPIYNRDLIYWDFEEMPPKFWYDKNNRINRIKYYCEKECNNSILDSIDDTNKLKWWVYKNFRQEHLNSIITYGKNGIHSLYDLLVEAYPQIKNNNLLFEWEWHQYGKSDKESLIRMLRELIIYRLSDIIIDYKEDIPKYINQVYMKELYPKFNKQLHKKRFNSYYEWVCLSFPEYKDYWTPQMFNDAVAYDGTICDSKQEMLIYEFTKKDMNLVYLKHIGRKKTGKYTFKLGDEYNYERFCPDFVLEYIDYNGIKMKLDKPLYIEYYGWHAPTHNGLIFINYNKKIQVKNAFYKNNSEINFIDLYPDDLKNNLQGIRDKLITVLKDKYNIAA